MQKAQSFVLGIRPPVATMHDQRFTNGLVVRFEPRCIWQGSSMVRQKGKVVPSKVVWRISAAAPMGEFVDLAEVARARTEKRPAKPAPEPREPDFSSLDLLNGAGVSETPMDTLPGELIDEFFKPRR